MKINGADLNSGLIVFLVALPLCLGISLASGAPLFSGLIAGIIGGIIIAPLSGSSLSVSGPAAGLALIVLDAIEALGDYQIFILAVFIAGLFQILLGVLKAGFIANLFPNSVIKGMLSAIGLVIFLKQIPHALGRDKDYEGELEFQQLADGENTLTELLVALEQFSPGAMIISVVALAAILLWERPFMKKMTFTRYVSGPLMAVVLGIALNAFFDSFIPEFCLRGTEGHLVKLPVADGIQEFASFFLIPKFSEIDNGAVWVTAGTLAMVASLETLLCVEATDKIDPQRRISNPNREMFAQGVGNSLSGLIGGLPITSVIVRSSANAYSGAKTRFSAFFHGILLLLAVTLFPRVLNLIPLASLAAILLVLGYKLINPKLFKELYQTGWRQFLPFLVTVAAIFFTNLLYGVLIGLLVGIFVILWTDYHSAITHIEEGNTSLIKFNTDVSFVNKLKLKKLLAETPEGTHLIIDGSSTLYIDHDVWETIQDFKDLAKIKNIKLELVNIDSKLK